MALETGAPRSMVSEHADKRLKAIRVNAALRIENPSLLQTRWYTLSADES
jgi:hypothetical protein